MGGRGRLSLTKIPTPTQQPSINHPQSDHNQVSQMQSFSLWGKRFMLHIWHPNPGDLHWRDKAPEWLALKTNRTCVQETQRDVGSWESLLKGLHVDSCTPKTQHKSSSLKVTLPCVKEIHLLNLSACWRGRGLTGLSGDRDAGAHDFGALILLGRASDGGWHVLHPSQCQWVCLNPALSHGFAKANRCISPQCSPTVSLKLAGMPRSWTTPQHH